MPRGFWPIERRWRTDYDQMRWFSWVRHWQNIFLQGLEHHLQVPLQRREQEASPEFHASSTTSILGSTELEATDVGSPDEQASSSADEEASRRARSRSRSPRPSTSGSSADTRHVDEEGNELDRNAGSAGSGASNTNPSTPMWRPPSLSPSVNATTTPVDASTLPGIWRDPPLVDWGRVWGPGTSTTSTLGTGLLAATSWTTTSWTTWTTCSASSSTSPTSWTTCSTTGWSSPRVLLRGMTNHSTALQRG